MHAQWSPPCVRAMQCGKQCACGARCTVRMQYARAVSRIFCLSSPGATQRRRAPCDRVHHLRCRRLGVGAAGACERRVRRWERQHRQPVRCRRGAVRGAIVHIGLGQRGGGGQQKAGLKWVQLLMLFIPCSLHDALCCHAQTCSPCPPPRRGGGYRQNIKTDTSRASALARPRVHTHTYRRVRNELQLYATHGDRSNHKREQSSRPVSTVSSVRCLTAYVLKGPAVSAW